MIFATIGTQAPFDRFVKILDQVSARLEEPVVCQTIPQKHGYTPQHLTAVGFLAPDEFDQYFNQARLVVAHAGMGTVLEALSHEKPLIIFPRRAAMHEHRNDHQLATAKRMRELGLVYVAFTEQELCDLLERPDQKPLVPASPHASAQLINTIKGILNT